MKSKLIITLTALLMLGGISAMAQGSNPKGDINEDGVVNAADVVALVNIIMNGGGSSGETKYYWYVGADPVTAATTPGSDSNWHEISGTPSSIETGDHESEEKVNWVLAVPTALGLNHLSNGDDVTDLYDVTIVTCADGVEYKVFTQARASKRIDLIFVKVSSDEAKYYWYAGTTLPTADNIESIALGSSNTIEHWDGKEFSITNSGEESTPAYVCTPVDFRVSWKDTNGFTLNLVEVEGAGFTLNGVEYKVQKRGRDLSAGAELTCLGYYTDYWYVGNVEPTAATNPVTESGWTALYSKPEQIKIFKEDSEFNDVQWYLAAPAEWGFETTYNGIQVGGWTKTTITINHVLYNVWTCQALTDTVNVTLANIDN